MAKKGRKKSRAGKKKSAEEAKAMYYYSAQW
jgi:hypothetical protein